MYRARSPVPYLILSKYNERGTNDNMASVVGVMWPYGYVKEYIECTFLSLITIALMNHRASFFEIGSIHGTALERSVS